jgi:putative SOS response-associated peptidase YedK
VLADGFYEWHWLDEKGNKKQKYLITLPDEAPFAFAGLYSEWVDKSTGEIFHTYTVVSTAADAFMSEVHNSKKRMPVILTPENEYDWLSGESVVDFAKPVVELVKVEV